MKLFDVDQDEQNLIDDTDKGPVFDNSRVGERINTERVSQLKFT